MRVVILKNHVMHVGFGIGLENFILENFIY
jgi:hypothetical protein